MRQRPPVSHPSAFDGCFLAMSAAAPILRLKRVEIGSDNNNATTERLSWLPRRGSIGARGNDERNRALTWSIIPAGRISVQSFRQFHRLSVALLVAAALVVVVTAQTRQPFSRVAVMVTPDHPDWTYQPGEAGDVSHRRGARRPPGCRRDGQVRHRAGDAAAGDRRRRPSSARRR